MGIHPALSPSPLLRDVSGLSSLDGGVGEESVKGDPGSERPTQYVAKICHGKRRGLFYTITNDLNLTV